MHQITNRRLNATHVSSKLTVSDARTSVSACHSVTFKSINRDFHPVLGDRPYVVFISLFFSLIFGDFFDCGCERVIFVLEMYLSNSRSIFKTFTSGFSLLSILTRTLTNRLTSALLGYKGCAGAASC